MPAPGCSLTVPFPPCERRRGPAVGSTGLARLACVAVSLAACADTPGGPRPASEANLLSGHLSGQSPGAVRVEPSVDGTFAPEGDVWDTPLTSVLRTPNDYLLFDLGGPLTIDAAFIQADNNDLYTLSGSLDGQTFTPFWVAAAVQGAGLRSRTGQSLHTQARYVRVTASGGDGAFSLSEVQVYARAPRDWPVPPESAVREGDAPNRGVILIWGLACALFLLFGCYGTNRRALGLAALPAVATWRLIADVATDMPRFNDNDISLLRAVVAGLALLAVFRERIKLGRGSFVSRRVTALMGLLAVAGVACFYNLGRPQFYDAKLRQPSYVHNYDMRVYFPVAKYFHELSYDGLYLASVASYVDNHPGTTLESLATVELRDLRNHGMRRVQDVMPEINAVRQRFSPERWTAFREDMRYFQETMGRDYFSTMSDHGGNATPVWLVVANVMFRWTTASNAVLLATACLDPLLLVLLGWVLARAYGLRTAFLCLILFGANDYYMFGTNWAGATLRHDWMVALGLGAAALKRQRFAVGGALLAYGGLIRAFPALAVFALMGPPVWWLVMDRRRHSRWPTRKELFATHPGAVRALGGALVTVVVAVLISSAVLSPSAWVLWFKKAVVLSAGDHVNHLSLRMIASVNFATGEMVSNWSHDPGRVVFFGVGLVAFTMLSINALRGRSPETVAVLGLLLIPVFFYPANYYSHVVFVLPLLAATPGETSRDRWLWGVLCAMCVAEYATTHSRSVGRHFMGESFILMTAYLLLLVGMRPSRSTIATSEKAA